MKIGIVGYGNLGRGAEAAVRQNKDMELEAVFTRRINENIRPYSDGVKVEKYENILKYTDKIDVLLLCGGSATDLPDITPFLARYFNVVDSFDRHSEISRHLERVDACARGGGKLAVISAGWDPGLFSLARIYFAAALPDGKTYTFWGKGVSQGHSQAARKIKGVVDAKAYTLPDKSYVRQVLGGLTPELSAGDMHKRECFIVPEASADRQRIENEIKSMPDYFAPYSTAVNFISDSEMRLRHSSMRHGGLVIRNGESGINKQNRHTAELKLKLDSNPEFTAGVLLAFARAAFKMNKRGESGCKTPADIAPADISPLEHSELIKAFL